MKQFLANLALLLFGLLLALLLAELASRLLRPVFPGAQRVAVSGPEQPRPISPGAVFYQLGEEYRALTSITADGYRVPESPGNPEEILLGDSFTWGQGLADEQTFAWIYCRALARACANLGIPGSGTARQLDRLERYLRERQWRPRRVRLFLLAMTGSFSAGNDLADNLAWARRSESRETEAGSLDWLLARRESLLRHSNLARLVKFHFGPVIKGWISPGLDARRLEQALQLTGAQLRRLERLAQDFGFDYEILLLHPVQDILRGTAADTRERLDAFSPIPLVPTAPLFTESPGRFYFPLDGHFNPLGARTLAEFLISREDR